MNCNSFAVASGGGYYFYPLPGGSPFKVRLTLKGVAAPQEISRLGGSERAFVLLRQVHGTKVVPAAEALHYPEREEADGLLITPGSPLCGLQFGDCVPVLILSASREPWMLALHSGFRGTLKNIVASGMDAVRKEGMAADGEKLHAWVGPCISGSCYSRSMSDPTAEEALRSFSADAVRREGGVLYLDLKRQIARQLAAEGIPERNIWLESQCTCCRSDLFYSHRKSRGGEDPRMLLTICSSCTQKQDKS